MRVLYMTKEEIPAAMTAKAETMVMDPAREEAAF